MGSARTIASCLVLTVACLLFTGGCIENKDIILCKEESELLMIAIEKQKTEIKDQNAKITELKQNEADSMVFMIETLEELGNCQNSLIDIEEEYDKLQKECDKSKKPE